MDSIRGPRLTTCGDWLTKWLQILLRRRRECVACHRQQSARRYRHCQAWERTMGMEYWYCAACERIQNHAGLH